MQVVDKIEVAQLNTSPVPNSTNDAAKRAILKAAHQANPPFTPSSKGGSSRYIVPNVLDAVRQATGLSWADRDLAKHVDSLVKEMTAVGWLRVENVKVGRNPRQGVIVEHARTPWAQEFAGPRAAGSAAKDQMHQIPIEATGSGGAGDIDARRTEGASNVPMGSGDLMKQRFDAAAAAPAADGKRASAAAEATEAGVPTGSAPCVTAVEPASPTVVRNRTQPAADHANKPKVQVGVQAPALPIAPATPTDPDDLTIPDFLLRRPLPGPAAAEPAPGPDCHQEAPRGAERPDGQWRGL